MSSFAEALSICAIERADRVSERAADNIGVLVLVDRDDPRSAGWKRFVHLLADPRLEALARDLAEDRAACCSDRGRGEERRREEADDETDASAHLGALAPEMVARLLHLDLALGVLRDEHDAVGGDRARVGELHVSVEVLLRKVGDQVDGDENIELVVVAHLAPL